MTTDDERRVDIPSRERIAVLETQMTAMMNQQTNMAENIAKILETLSEARGGWRMMMLLGGGAGILGAFIGKWVGSVSWTIK